MGLAALIALTFLLAVNQIVVKEVNPGLQPVFFAKARSALENGFVYAWLKYSGLCDRRLWADLGPVFPSTRCLPSSFAACACSCPWT